jgi:hypothetical protein
MNTIQFYAIFSNGSKILFSANSIKAAKSFKTKYAKANNTTFVQGGHAYTLSEIGENISKFKAI